MAPNLTGARAIRAIQTMSGSNGCEWLPPLNDEPPGPLARTMLLITSPRPLNLGSARFSSTLRLKFGQPPLSRCLVDIFVISLSVHRWHIFTAFRDNGLSCYGKSRPQIADCGDHPH